MDDIAIAVRGLHKRYKDTVAVDGLDLEVRRGEVFSLLGQSVHDAAELTVEEMVTHFTCYYPDPRNPDEVIDLVGLSAKRKARTRQLSGGQRRRLDVHWGFSGDPNCSFSTNRRRGSTRRRAASSGRSFGN